MAGIDQNGFDKVDDSRIWDEAYANERDASEDLPKPLRDEFVIPTRADLKRKDLSQASSDEDSEPCTYLCGNSLGLQPKNTAKYTAEYHRTWATKGVYGHFTEIEGSHLAPWLHVDDDVVEDMAKIVGAQSNEVAVMQTLTANLHLLLCSFYKPTKERYKIIIEGKAFPSDHYAIESQIRMHNLSPSSAMILLTPTTPTKPTLSTSHILSVIDAHADSTAILLLPGIQFYTGQLFDMATITAHAQAKGILVGWDLAHAVGNVPLALHDLNVDFAAWCTYKYLNCGPGAIGGLFVHERHSAVEGSQDEESNGSGSLGYRPRLAGWWGSGKQSRFQMDNRFTPIPGAAGWQLSNPSVADMTAVRASLDVFKRTDMAALRRRSLALTGYLEKLLTTAPERGKELLDGVFEIITPRSPSERGAQLSLKLAPGLLDTVMKVLESEGVVVDERRPDVIRVAPAPLYNTYADVLRFVKVFRGACGQAVEAKSAGRKRKGSDSIMVDGGKDAKGWSEVK